MSYLLIADWPGLGLEGVHLQVPDRFLVVPTRNQRRLDEGNKQESLPAIMQAGIHAVFRVVETNGDILRRNVEPLVRHSFGTGSRG